MLPSNKFLDIRITRSMVVMMVVKMVVMMMMMAIVVVVVVSMVVMAIHAAQQPVPRHFNLMITITRAFLGKKTCRNEMEH